MDLTQVSSSTPEQRRAGASAPHHSRLLDDRPFLKRLAPFDWLFALVLVGGAGFALSRYHGFMNYYDKLVLVCAVPVFVVLG